MLAIVAVSCLVLSAPAPDRQPLPVADATAAVDVLVSAVGDFARNLKGIEPESVTDMKLFSEVQRSRLRGFMVVLRATERELSSVESPKLRDLLLDGCRAQRVVLEQALLALKGVEDKKDAIDVSRAVGEAVSTAAPFARFYREQFSRPTVGEIVIPAP